MRFDDNALSIGRTPLVKLNRVVDGGSSHRSGQDRRPQPGLFGEVPHRRIHGVGRRSAGRAHPGEGTDRAHQREHGHRAGFRGRGQGLPHHADHAGDDVAGTAQGAGGVRREAGADRRRRWA